MKEDLIVRYLNGECTPEESRELLARVKENPDEADQFMRFASIHGHLRTRLQGQSFGWESDVSVMAAPPAVGARDRTRDRTPSLRVLFGLALAACLLVLLTLNNGRSPDRGDDSPPVVGHSPGKVATNRSVASLVQTIGNFRGGPGLEQGVRLSAGLIRIDEGVALLRFDQDVEVILEGPAELEIVSAGKTRLASGLLAAYVPPGAEGFQVDTPRMGVVDLGTFFGVRTGPDGAVDVSVFEGEVSLSPKLDDRSQILRAGRAVRSTDGVNLESVAIDTNSFAGLWEIASGILDSSDAFVVLPPPHQYRSRFSDTAVAVYREGGFAPLPEDLRVNISRPAEYWKVSDLTESTLARGTVARSYLLQFRPVFRKVVTAGQFEFLKVRGELTFTDPIVGVIILEDELAASERILAVNTMTKRPGMNRSLELSDKEFGDFLAISEDRHTLRVQLRAASGFSDHIRVLVSPVAVAR
jgi:hypothetical protein